MARTWCEVLAGRMTTRHGPWPTGTPGWADIVVPDLAVARAFYGPLLGWRFEVRDGRTQAFLDDRRVVGLAEFVGHTLPVQPAWCVYLATDDLPATAAAVTDAGGRVVVAPRRVPGLGEVALATDPAGAVFGLWEPVGHTGWDVAAEAGAVVWSEVMVHDQPRALAFYRRVFGYTVDDLSAAGFAYAAVQLDDAAVAGVGGYSAQAGADAPAAWTVYFGVRDADLAVARVVELGGRVLSPPADSTFGRIAIVAGPFGEVFALMGPRPDA
jgi:predicted enzyme related to lactoylglutathione lyase